MEAVSADITLFNARLTMHARQAADGHLDYLSVTKHQSINPVLLAKFEVCLHLRLMGMEQVPFTAPCAACQPTSQHNYILSGESMASIAGSPFGIASFNCQY